MAWLTWVRFLSPWQLLSWGTFGAELGFGPCAGEADLCLERVSLVLITVKQTSIIVNQWSLSLQVNYRWAQTALAVIMPVSGVQCGRGRFGKMKRAVLCVSRWPSWLPHSHEDGLYWSGHIFPLAPVVTNCTICQMVQWGEGTAWGCDMWQTEVNWPVWELDW